MILDKLPVLEYLETSQNSFGKKRQLSNSQIFVVKLSLGIILLKISAEMIEF